MKKEAQPKFVIDVDKAIDIYNKKNPKLKPLDRAELAQKLKISKQVFSDWKNRRTPKLVERLFLIRDIAGCKIDDFITPHEEE